MLRPNYEFRMRIRLQVQTGTEFNKAMNNVVEGLCEDKFVFQILSKQEDEHIDSGFKF